MEVTGSGVPQKAKSMERALQHLSAKVVTGVLMPGEQIRQQEMALELGVSRVPLREALNVLADQGLLIHRPNSGYFVAKRAPNELAQIGRILELLEDELVGSISWPDDDCIERLRQLNAQMRACSTASDWTPLIRLNREFHFEIFSLSPFLIIFGEVKRLWSLAEIFIATKMAETHARLRTVEEHDRLIASLLQRDHGICLQLMAEHRASTASGLPLEKPSMQSTLEEQLAQIPL